MSPLIHKRKSVLLVDDDSNARNSIRTCLQEHFPNSSILESTDGKDAYLKISRQKFDLVVTEIKLPKLDGNQLLKALKDFKSDLAPSRVLVASSLIPAGTQPDPHKPIAYMSKPAAGDPLISYL